MRPFGHAADLDLDFGHSDRPGLVTALLAQCSDDGVTPEFWWSQTVSRRIGELLKLVALTENRSEVSLSARCPSAGCGEAFEFELPLHSLHPGESPSGPIRVALSGERSVTIRPPVGADLREWRNARPASRAEAVRQMLGSLIVAGEAGPDDEAFVAASIAAQDPLVDFAVLCPCPACGEPGEVTIDLEVLALSRLAARQRGMMQDVHRLASRYGWTEAQALAVPAARRAFYLTLIEAGQ